MNASLHPPSYARRTVHLNANAVRDILRTAESPQIISFAGGLPATDLFPAKELASICQRVCEKGFSPRFQAVDHEVDHG